MILINGKRKSECVDRDLEDILEEQEFVLKLTPGEFRKVNEFLEDVKTKNAEALNARHSNCECVKPIFTVIGKNGTLVITNNCVSDVLNNNTVTYILGNTKLFYPERKDLNSPIFIETITINPGIVDYRITIRD